MSDPGTPLEDLSNALATAVERAARATVRVDARARIPATGIVWSDGVVVTADHVVERDEDVSVGLPDDAVVDATVVGRDPGSDVVVLRIASATPAIALAPDESQRIGSLVLALGRPGAGGPEASLGVISASGGPWRTFRGGRVGGSIRSDTTFFPGFSGGPLIDVAGRMVGLNSSHLGRGAGLTVPHAALTPIVEALLGGGRVRRSYLGIGSQVARLPESMGAKLDGQETGLLIITVEPESPAGRAGLMIGDVLVRFDGAAITDTEALQAELGPERVEQTVALTVLRGGEPAEIAVTVGERT